MRPYRGGLAWIAIFLLAALLLGCSAARLGYSNGEIISYWWLNSYVDFDEDQKPQVRKHIANMFAWHRKTQLPEYITLLKQAQQRVHGKVTPAELLKDYDDAKGRVAVIAEKALPHLAEVALTLSPTQIDNIEKKFASGNDEYRKDHLRGDVEQRQRFRYKKALKQAEYWFGDFSPEQEKLLRQASDARPLDNELVLADRIARQKTLLALLRKVQAERPAREAVMGMFKEYIDAVMNREISPQHRAFFDETRQANMRMMAVIVNNATPQQREHFVRNLQQWINDFGAMAH